MNRRHKWRTEDIHKPWHQICSRCDASRWGGTNGWGRALNAKTKLPQRWCDG